MSLVHGKHTVVIIDSNDISVYTNDTKFNDGRETHDATTYGPVERKEYRYGLGDGTITLTGVYDDSAAGPRAVMRPLMLAGSIVPFVYRPEGTGLGRAQSRVNVVIEEFQESSPVAGLCQWTATLTMSGAVDDTDQ
jgi:hypothetical protein